MKKLLSILIVSPILVANAVFAGNWSINCTNNSCVAEQGALKVYWMANSYNNIYSGKLTGVEGIPITIDDYQAVEKKIESVIEKSITRKKTSEIGVKADPPEDIKGPTAGVTGTKENLFTKKRAISQSKTTGRKVSVDHTLALVEWLGDTMFSFDSSIKRYFLAAEYALSRYKDNTIEDLIEYFFLQRNAERIDEIPVNTKLTEENRDLVLAKYIALTKYPNVDLHYRYAHAVDFLQKLSEPYMSETAEKLSDEFKKDLKSLELLLKPNQTALKLYKTDKDLAFGKWLADNNKFVDAINKMAIQDKYVFAIRVVERLKNKQLSEKDINFLTEHRNEFEKAIQNKDESVQIVTVKGSSIPLIATILVLGLIVTGIVLLVRKKKSGGLK